MKTVLLATDSKFWLDDRGGRRRIASLCRYLIDKGFKVMFFWVGELDDNDVKMIQADYGAPDVFILPKKPSNVENDLDSRRLPRLRKNNIKQSLKKLLPDKALILIRSLRKHKIRQPTPYKEPTLDSFFSEDYQHYFQDVCREVTPDFIIIEFVRLAYLIQDSHQFLPRHTLTMIDTLDVMYQRCQRFHDHGELHWINISEEEEKEALNLFDVILAIQNRDAETFRRMLPHKKVITVGHVVEITLHEPQYKSTINLTYIAASGPANRRAIMNFMETVWPMLYKQFGNRICLKIVGSIYNNLSASVLPDGVDLIEYVSQKVFQDDLKTVYRDADIIINPVYFGGGLKIKNVEALCNGKPLVTTTVGAEGLEHGIDDSFFVCDTPESTFSKLSELIDNSDLRSKMSEQTYAFALSNFTEDKAYRELYDILLNSH